MTLWELLFFHAIDWILRGGKSIFTDDLSRWYRYSTSRRVLTLHSVLRPVLRTIDQFDVIISIQHANVTSKYLVWIDLVCLSVTKDAWSFVKLVGYHLIRRQKFLFTLSHAPFFLSLSLYIYILLPCTDFFQMAQFTTGQHWLGNTLALNRRYALSELHCATQPWWVAGNWSVLWVTVKPLV